VESAEYEIRLRDSFSQGLGRLENRMNKFESKVGGLGTTIAGVFGGIGLASLASGALSFLGNMGKSIVTLGAEMEQTKISFETMLGSADKAQKTLKELQDFAKVTPFSQKDVITGAKSLLAYGFEAQNLTKDLTTLGDVSAGLSIPINDLIYLYGTLKTQGKAMTKDLMQFAGRGIPIYKELGKVLGTNEQGVAKLVTEGKVGFKEVEKAFQNMTAAGSMFGGLMEKQGKSLSGRWSTFKDTLEIMGTNLGTKVLPTLGKMLDTLSSIVNVIPELDFSVIGDTFSQINTEIDEFLNAFNSLFGLTRDSLSTFDTLSFIIRSISFSLRTGLFPLRFMIEMFTDLITLIKGSINIFQGFGQLLKGVFTLDVDKINEGIETIGGATVDMVTKIKDSIGDFAKREVEGYGKIFSPFDTPDKTKASATSGAGVTGRPGASMSGSKAGSAIGVEKIQSGTRNVVVNIQKLIENVTFEKGYKEGEAKLQEMITKALLVSVNDVNIVAQ
jgi:hypothetical protein